VTQALEAYDVPGATRPIQAFVDTLSKWYLRRSRRRFWKSESDADKKAAYATLYEGLVTLSKLLAPTMPFLAEDMYQNLVRAVNRDAHESVHLTEWPEYDQQAIDEELNRDMELVMKLASLGHAARNQAAIKVRQPLAEAAFAVSSAAESRALERHAELLTDELNVKQVRLLGTAGEAVSYSLNPLPKQLGQRFKGQFPAVRAAILELDPERAALALLEGSPVEVTVDGQTVAVEPGEVEVRVQARAGLTVASEGPYLCALATELTLELVSEGLAREFVRRVQDFRKQANLDIADRIRLYVQPSPTLGGAIRKHSDYITGETLTVDLQFKDPPASVQSTTTEFDGETALIGVEKAA
jgi:isoleucyl-tRNA synthetase